VVSAESAVSGVLRDVTPVLDERQRRLLAGAGARALGRGGVSMVASATGMSRNTVRRGVRELEAGPSVVGQDRVRAKGAGRKRATESDPELLGAVEALVDRESRGDPESPLRWTCKSTRKLARTLTEAGHATSHVRVGELLHGLGFHLQANAKTIEGKQHPDRDAQFRYINRQASEHLAAGQIVVSVDAKKKELVGDEPPYKNGGREWERSGDPERVGVHDFPAKDLGKAIPYGVYDICANTGFVVVGQDHDTAAFAAETLRRWCAQVGQVAYPNATRMLICADAGGSNGYRLRLWKVELARLAAETGLQITVCHYPPGTSKWNRIEHRLFSHISMNWRGRPLTSHEVVVELIGATTTSTGLSVHAERDTGSYPKGIKITKAQVAALPIARHEFHGEWNYTFHP
jgi:hypothetical protein